jgi:plastocyanin
VRKLVAVVLLSVVIAAAGCGKDPSTGSPDSPPTPTGTTASASATTSATPRSTLPPGVDQLVRITVRDGEVSGVPSRVKVAAGSTVQLRVDSDVADEVHLHGYDKSVDVEPGRTARLTFTASISGLFEVELESRGLRLTQLQVQ